MSFVSDALGSVGNIVGSVMGLGSAQQTSQAGAAGTKAGEAQLGYEQQASQQLQQLLRNPSSVTSMGGYQTGLDAVLRTMASRGMTMSGNENLALLNYGNSFYQQQMQLLQSLASGTPSTVKALDTSTGTQSSGAGGFGPLLQQLGQGLGGLGQLGSLTGLGGGVADGAGFVGAGGMATDFAGSAGVGDALVSMAALA